MSTIKCVVCQEESEVKKLKQQIIELNLKLSQYVHEVMKVTNDDRQRLEEEFEYSNTPLLNEDFNVEGYYFVTLTYDPKKFGYMQTEKAQQEYFLANVSRYKYPTYGCFEHHKNGNVHFHFIIQASLEQVKQMKNEMRHKFTDNNRNKDFMDIGIAKHKTAIRYINKESKKYIKRRNV